MSQPRSRRLLRIVALTMLPFVLLASYFCTWLMLLWLHGRTWIAYRDFTRLENTVFLPVHWVMHSDSPGAETVEALGQWAYNDGYHALLREANRHRQFPAAPADAPAGKN